MNGNYAPRKGGIGKGLAAVVLAGAIGAGGFYAGRRSVGFESVNMDVYSKPVAAGMADIVPSNIDAKYQTGFTMEVRDNGNGERVTYLQNRQAGVEVPIADNAWDVMNASQGKGKLIINGAVKTVAATRGLYDIFGGTPEGPKALGGLERKTTE